MLADRSTKIMLAVFALLAGILLNIKYIVDEAPLKEWWPAGVLYIIAAALYSWMLQEEQPGTAASKEAVAPAAKEEVVTKATEAKKAVAKAEAAVTKAKDAVPATPVEEKAPPPPPVNKPEPVEATPAPVKAEAPPVEERPKPAKEERAPAPDKPAPAEAKKDAAEDEVDDLTRIEGIGPKYRDVLLAGGIQTFDQLAKTSEDELVTIVKAGKMRRTASMSTWAEQAGYAARDDWEGLDKLQDDLKGGRR